MAEENTRITRVWGGQGKQKYFTPDGRTIFAIPSTRQYVVKDSEGKVVEEGQRDANYDKGWLPIMPKELKMYCKHCDNWHDTQEEIDKCGANAKAFEIKAVRRNSKTPTENNEITTLRTEVGELKEMMKVLLEGKIG